MVRASMTTPQPYHGCVKVLPASAVRRGEHGAPLAVLLLVEADDRLRGRVGGAQPVDDVGRAHLAVARPRLVDAQLRAWVGGALALDERVGLLVGVAGLQAEVLGHL